MGRISNGTVASTDFTEVHSRSLNDRWDVMSAHRNKAFKLCTAAEMIDPRLISSVQPLQNKHPVPWYGFFFLAVSDTRTHTHTHQVAAVYPHKYDLAKATFARATRPAHPV